MRQRQFDGPKLPAELLQQVGVFAGSGRNRQNYQGANGRKAKRQAERVQKKQIKRLPKPTPKRFASPEEESSLDDAPPRVRNPPHVATNSKPKSILKITKAPTRHTDSEDETEQEEGSTRSTGSRSESESESESECEKVVSRPDIPNSTKRRLEEEDAEIAALERKLGNRGKKAQNGEDDDGLDFILEGLGGSDSDTQPSKRKRSTEDEEWLASKRRKAESEKKKRKVNAKIKAKKSKFEEEADSDESIDSEHSSEEPDTEEQLEDSAVDDDFSGFDSETSDEPEAQRKPRENPYVAPVQVSATLSSEKYVPPSLRKPPSSEAESLTQLRRQVQGLLNRLSEANLPTILKDIENVYLNNARQYVTTTLIDLLLTLICDRTTLNDTFLILHAGFITAVYKVVGTDFGAQLVERLVAEFDKSYRNNANTPETGKEPSNLISLMSELYNFQVIGSNIIFDYLRDFLSQLTDLHTELILRMVKLSGHQLRQDDPSALKHIVLLLQKSVSEAGEANLPVRTKFMIETINNLKNNRMKTGLTASSITAEHTTRMKKQLGALNTRSIKATEPLRIGLSDIRNTDKKGKWWLVGASWKGNDSAATPTSTSTEDTLSSSSKSKTKPLTLDLPADLTTTDCDTTPSDLPTLARALRMNTSIRRAIFTSIMSAADYKDAHTRLLKLRLKRAQEPEIPRVLLACAGGETAYNPFYTIVARKLCATHRIRMAFQFALWDLVKRMSVDEDDHDDAEADEGGDVLDMPRIVNFAKTYGSLIATQALPLTCLKTIEFPYLEPKLSSFVEVLLVTVIQEAAKIGKEKTGEHKVLKEVFTEVRQTPGLASGLQYFVGEVVRKGEIVSGRKERGAIRKGCDIIGKVLAGASEEAVEEQ
ncbi:hypothetical protein EJ05DRAFT_536271 [Pseudovirgaria hyperparasitica]|uniref:MI domain-containing protein n=1 Tax=Pseudovirgaria hyperparasitica TaxID=470096 RepID=A0A6A6WD36_9PEZI|nr:uncharacterized protein EJ05DRAFT_536271 [Pseudovirgaria hyperparasitica]KAF2760089.1 hypothetical protein EJ05DRAFT_536271 [Pseudovirgaria hyperparasitica]